MLRIFNEARQAMMNDPAMNVLENIGRDLNQLLKSPTGSSIFIIRVKGMNCH